MNTAFPLVAGRPAAACDSVDADLFGAVPAPVLSLPDLAAAINADHAAVERHAAKTVERAGSAGDKLIQAKALCRHGEWLPWLSANCPTVADRTARAYMQVARNWSALMGKSADSANLSIDAALKLLAAPAPEPVTGELLPAVVTAFEPQLEPALQPASPITPLPEWSVSQLERRQLVEQGFAVIASKRNGADGKPIDAALIAWATQQGLMTPIDRSSAWGNPFEMPADGDRNDVCELFAEFLTAKPSLLKKLKTLKGKVLVCWCHPERCHGDHLAALANAENQKGELLQSHSSIGADGKERQTTPIALPAVSTASRKAPLCSLSATEIEQLRKEQFEQNNFEANRAAFHNALSQLFYGAGIVHNPADCVDPDRWIGTWDKFYGRYNHSFDEFRDRLITLQQKIPFVLEVLDGMRKGKQGAAP